MTDPHPGNPATAHTGVVGAAAGRGRGRQGATAREARLAGDFVALADALADDFDVPEVLQLLAERCIDYLEVAAAGVLLTDQRGGLQVAAATSRTAEALELFEIHAAHGPCTDTVASGHPTISRDLAADAARWPRFAPQAQQVGIRAVTALPLRLRAQIIGALNLFHTVTGGLPEADQQVAQALADVATIGIVTHRAARDSLQLTEQLQAALNSRVVIEQAKGILAQYGGISTDQAFTVLRSYARRHNRRLSELALSILAGRTLLADLASTPPDPARSSTEDTGVEERHATHMRRDATS